MAYTTIDDPEAYFQVKTYTGDGSTPSITLDGDTDMQPDIVWIKNRDATDAHCLFNSVRGATKVMHSNVTTAEATDADTLTSFDSDGFALGADVKVNTNTEAYAAWCWKESATAGLDIVSWTGNITGRTISHNLSAVPKWIMTFCSDTAKARTCYHHKMAADPDNAGIFMEQTANPTTGTAAYFNNTAPTTSVFSIGTSTNVNNDGSPMFAYVWSEVQGFSKFGGYTGNANADGTFVYTGFRPAWIMVKQTSGALQNWHLWDSKRDSYNVADAPLKPDENYAQSGIGAYKIDILSNGFKFRGTEIQINASGETYIYMAFAEAPFVNSNGVPCNAR